MLRTLIDAWPLYPLPNHLILKKIGHSILKLIDYEAKESFE
jgi:hypothetical protein